MDDGLLLFYSKVNILKLYLSEFKIIDFNYFIFSSFFILFYFIFIFGDLGLGLRWHYSHTVTHQSHNMVTVTVMCYIEKHRKPSTFFSLVPWSMLWPHHQMWLTWLITSNHNPRVLKIEEMKNKWKRKSKWKKIKKNKVQ